MTSLKKCVTYNTHFPLKLRREFKLGSYVSIHGKAKCPIFWRYSLVFIIQATHAIGNQKQVQCLSHGADWLDVLRVRLCTRIQRSSVYAQELCEASTYRTEQYNRRVAAASTSLHICFSAFVFRRSEQEIRRNFFASPSRSRY